MITSRVLITNLIHDTVMVVINEQVIKMAYTTLHDIHNSYLAVSYTLTWLPIPFPRLLLPPHLLPQHCPHTTPPHHALTALPSHHAPTPCAPT